MPAYNLLPFQRDAIDDINKAFLRLWKKDGRQLTLVFKSPTGSGKTLTIAHFIRGLNHLPQWKIDKAFIWITFSDDLAMQSMEKFGEYFENNLENNLLAVNEINRGKLFENDILFLNWQKIVSRSAENRVLRRPSEGEVIRKESGKYFEDVIDATKKDKREIILVIDEAHTHKSTELAQEMINYIDPKVILHITATPDDKDVVKAATFNSFVQVDRERVVDEGLIKEKIIVPTEEDLKKYKGEDLDDFLLELGMEKRTRIKAELAALGKNINPLMLIQLPNDDKQLVTKGEKTKEEVVGDFLVKVGVQKRQIAKWFDGKKENMDFIKDQDSKVDFMLFKQAAGTGWDCPRAYVLVMFREIKSEKFYSQTVGRILRMPEPEAKEDYKNSHDLRIGYLYTNHERDQIELPDGGQNKIFTQHAYCKEGIKNVAIISAYISRVDYGDIPASYPFQASFKESMDAYFGVTAKDILGKAEIKLKKKGLNLDGNLTNSIIADAQFEDFDQLAFDFKKKENGIDVNLEMSTNDVEKTFNFLCYQVLKEQTDEDAKYTNFARSWSVLKSAIRIWFKTTLGDNSNYYYRVFVKDLQKNRASVLKPAITKALIDFKPTAKAILKKKKQQQEEREAPMFEVRESYDFTDDYQAVPQEKCVLDKCFILKEYNGRKNELDFIKYLEGLTTRIDWWFKNGNQGKEYFAVKYENSADDKEELFYPDWIIRFKNGAIGIFDTKQGQTATDPVTADKARALATKLKTLGKKFVGGIVVPENGIWYLNSSPNYSYQKGRISKDKNWMPMEEFF